MDWKFSLDEINNKVKSQLHSKGIDSLASIYDSFLKYDMDNSGTLNKIEFEQFFSAIGMFLTTQEVTTLFKHFDHDGNRQIAYREFIESLRQEFSEKRLASVKYAFEVLSTEGPVTVPGLESRFKAEAHPRVRTRQKKAETVFTEFMQGLRGRAGEAEISEASFIEFYADLNACLPAEKEEYFIDIVLSTWGLSQDSYITPKRIEELEDIIFEKIRQKTHGADDEGKTVMKTFRHFDLNGNGVICMDEFLQVLESYGCLFKENEITALFQRFDKDNSGKLDYEEFSGFIATKGFGKGNSPNVNPVFAMEREKPDQVLEKIRTKLKERGAHGIRGIGICFRRMDDSGDRKLDRMEFQWGLKENGHDISPAEFERIFKFFDRNGTGKIDYDEFIRAIRGDLNDFRRSLVGLAFKKLDKTGNGIVDMEDIKITYNVEMHPKFISGEMNATEILGDFLKQWDTLEKDGQVTLEEFEEYYKDVSASIDGDDYFELMIRNAWHIDGGEGQSECTTIPRKLEIGPDGKQRVVKAAIF